MATEKRLIDANALMKTLEELMCNMFGYQDYNYGVERATNAVEFAPTVDAVEVVRCKDCTSGKGSIYKVCPLYKHGLMKDEDFCSCGERKDNAE